MKYDYYRKDLKYSYAYGVYTTLELLDISPKLVMEVAISSKGSRNEGINKILAICKKNNINVINSDGLVNKLSGNEGTYAVGIFKKYTLELQQDQDHLVIMNPTDMGDLGTIIRTAKAFGIKNIAVLSSSADIFDPRIIRSSMGAYFGLNITSYNNFDGYFSKNEKARNYYLLNTGGVALETLELKKPCSLIFSNNLDVTINSVNVTNAYIKSLRNANLELPVMVAIGLYHNFTKS